MRIAIAHSSYRLAGGEDQYVTQEVDALKRLGHTVKLIARSNVDLHGNATTALRMTYSRRQVGEVLAELTRLKPDVIHVHNVYPSLGPSVHIAARKSGTPLVMTVHNYRLRCPNGYMFTEGELCQRCVRGNHLNAVVHRCFPSRKQGAAYAAALWIHRFPLRIQDVVSAYIAPSDFVRDQLTAWGIPPSRTTTIRNFTEVPAAARQTPGEYGMYLGRLSSEKGVALLLRALSLAEDPPFRIVGDGPLSQDLQALAIRLGLRHTVFEGYQSRDQVKERLLNSRYLVVPSLWHENAPLAALEAMAQGRALVVTNRGGLPELAAEGRGVIVDPNEQQLSDALRRLTESDEACGRLGAAGYRFALKNLTEDTHVSNLEHVLQSVR